MQHIEDTHRVVDDPPALMGCSSQTGRGALGEHQHREGLVGLADQGDHIRARPGKGNAADIQTCPEARDR